MTRIERSAAGLRAVILAGGKGARLKPFTANFPKPLVPLGDKPILEILIRRLIQYSITDITLSLGHMAELIKAYFACHHRLTEQFTLRYVDEEEPTGTAGSLALIPNLDTTFVVMNGDLLTNLDFDALVKFHDEQQSLLTIATHSRQVKIDLGVLEFDENHRLTSYVEKPARNYHVSMGVYVYEPEVLRYIEAGRYLDFPDLVLRLLAKGERVCSFPTDCLWLDIGRPDDYARAQDLFAEKEEEFDLV
ncbi:MAG TPA: sugar phosphate nucleotidyltransferase [Candidatus Saccharimonadales bacterium]|nr:sugar phosphate nucleotidyltransferase [Candidatus Saccharimonadales bacterium]